MKISREYILGLGSGLVLSAMLSLVWPFGLSSIVPQSMPVSKAAISNSEIPQGSPSKSPAGQATVSPEEKSQSSISSNPTTGQPQGTINTSQQQGNLGTSQPQGHLNTSQQQGNPASPGGQIQSERQFIVPNGATADKIAELLVNQGLITNKAQFLETVQKREAASRFRAGTYNLPGNLSYDEIVTKLLNPH